MDLRTYLIDCVLNNKSLIEELLFIDNKVQYTDITYESLLDRLKNVNKYDILDDNFTALTDGEFDTVFKVLISVPNLSTIYVNRTFLGLNKYLVNKTNQYYGYEKIKLDDSTDYRKYHNSADKIILSGFDTFVEEISKEFNREITIL